MNLRSLFWIGYGLVFFLASYWVFQLTSLSQFALLLLGYVGLAVGCLWWWTAHAYDESLGMESGKTASATNHTESVVSPAASRTT